MRASSPTPRTRVRRLPKRGVYDCETIDAILDEGLVCHVGFVHDGHPVVIPTLYAHVEDVVYFHGSAASRMLRTLADGVEACLTVTLIDGLVLARSAFHHSANYRSAVVFGRAQLIENSSEKLAALEAFAERAVPGRWAEVRPPTAKELKSTTVLSLPLDEASAKIRSGPPVDDDEDYALDVWAGVIPLRLVAGEPVPDPRLPAGVRVPEYARAYRFGSDVS